MPKPTQLDILVVYSSSIALSASMPNDQTQHPFDINSKRANYNLSYAYFLDYCHSIGLTAGFTTSSDITGPGTCSSYWTHDSTDWHKKLTPAHSMQIFDKLTPRTPTRAVERELLLSHNSITPFNDSTIRTVFFDKLLTYQQLPEYSIPTSNLYSSRPRDIKISLTRLHRFIKKHPHSSDFPSSIVLKDRFGAGGNHVYKITNNQSDQINQIMRNNPKIQFILQPFLLFDKGYSHQGKQAATDIRLIILHNQLLQGYIRIAKGKDFRCNEHQGGQLIYLENSQLPSTVIATSHKIITKINKSNSLYALDFAISNSGNVYFIEGNSSPGIDWNVNNPVNVSSSKYLIRNIVDEIASRLKHSHS